MKTNDNMSEIEKYGEWSKAIEKATGETVIGRLIVDQNDPWCGNFEVKEPKVTLLYRPRSRTTPVPLTPKEIFAAKLAGKI